MNQAVVDYAASCYAISPAQLEPISGGFFNRVFQFSRDDGVFMLRITPPNEEIDVQATRAILAWMHFLGQGGASVASPVLSVHHRLVEVCEGEDGRYLITAFLKAPGVVAEELSREQWSDALYQELGRAVGRMHALSRTYVPPDPTLRRPDWDQIVNCFNPGQTLDPSQETVAEKRGQILTAVQALPQHPDGYGLVHTDLHCANFFVDLATETVTIFDFDDCAYGWFVMDVAMFIFDLLVLYPGSEVDKQAFATRVLTRYLRGYLAENRLSPFWINRLSLFFKLLETGIYTQVYRHYDPARPDQSDRWVRTFMADRRRRIEAGVPYVDIDLTAIRRELGLDASCDA
jgi:amicoumacin kinase